MCVLVCVWEIERDRARIWDKQMRVCLCCYIILRSHTFIRRRFKLKIYGNGAFYFYYCVNWILNGLVTRYSLLVTWHAAQTFSRARLLVGGCAVHTYFHILGLGRRVHRCLLTVWMEYVIILFLPTHRLPPFPPFLFLRTRLLIECVIFFPTKWKFWIKIHWI